MISESKKYKMLTVSLPLVLFYASQNKPERESKNLWLID